MEKRVKAAEMLWFASKGLSARQASSRCLEVNLAAHCSALLLIGKQKTSLHVTYVTICYSAVSALG